MYVIKARTAWVVMGFMTAAGTIAGGAARAQTVAANNAQTAAANNDTGGMTLGLEEIIVTARKREESLQTVPISITALTAEQLRADTIKQASDLQYHTPGLEMRSGGGARDSLDYFIRGQGTTFGGGPAVVTYFADAPTKPQVQLASTLGDNQQFFDLASVQVLKGPQGTLFGRSTTGGAVLFEPARPTNEFSGTVQVSAGNLRYHEYQGFVNVPLINDVLKIRIAGDSVRRAGFTRSLSTGQEEDDRNRDSLRIGLSFTPTRWLDNYTLFQDNRAHEAGGSVVLLKVNNALPLFNPVPGFTPYGPTGGLIVGALCQAFNPGNPAAQGACFAQRTAILGNLINGLNAEAARTAQGGNEVRSNQTSVETQLQGHTQNLTNITKLNATELPYIGDIGFKNIFATQKNYGVRDLRELGGSSVTHATVVTTADVINFVPTYTPTSTGEDHWLDNFSEEAQFLGTVDHKHNWILGYYLEEHKFNINDPAVFTTFGNVFSPVLTAPTIASQMVGDSLSMVKGYFGQFTLDLSDWVLHGLKFTAGYRWSQSYARSLNLKGGYDATGTIVPNVTPGGPCACTATEPQPTLNDQAPSWNFSLDWQATDKFLVYATSRRGNKPGGVNIRPPVLFPGIELTFQPETLTDAEVGIKWDWTLDGHRGRTNADIYHQWYNNIQRTEFVPNPIDPTTPVQQTANIATAKIDGLELDTVMELTDRLSLSLTYAYINPKYTQWPGVTAPAPGVIGGLPLVNSPFPGTPRHQGTLGLRYTYPLESLGTLIAGADYYRQSVVQLNDQALADGNVIPPTPGYGNLNLRLDWNNVFSQPVDVDIFMRNATNNIHQVSVASLWSSFGFISAIYNEPRTWGAEVRYRFGAAAH
jgi:iron complex outermembrane receptor protein